MIQSNALNIPLKDESVQMCCTSPPYWGLRNYSVDGQLGLEKTPEEFIENCVKWAREVWRVLRSDGTFWLNLGDSYSGSGRGADGKYANQELSNDSLAVKPDWSKSNLKPKDLCGIPWRVALALQADGWWLRSAMPWVKRSAMPESCTDRPASALEYMFLLTKSSKYYFDMESVRVVAAYDGRHDTIMKGSEKYLAEIYPNQSPNTLASQGHERWPNKTLDGKRSRNFRNTDLYYQSLEEPHGAIFAGEEMVGLDVNPYSYKEAHFATFPPKLVEPCIKAGTSEKGACPECGAPWERVVEKGELKNISHCKTTPTGSQRGTKFEGQNIGSGWTMDGKFISGWQNENKTIGWQPTCKCGHKETVPCIVLDNFGGSGTTKNVAERLGRRGVMLELKMEYIEMAKKRCYEEPSLF